MIRSTQPPLQAKIHNSFLRVDFSDAYSFQIPDKNLSVEEVYIKIFSTSPLWVVWMLKLRNKLVSIFGLKTEMNPWKDKKLVEGEKAGIFKIYHIFKDEIIAGEDDKHLDFRVSLFLKDQMAYVTTFVLYNNAFGRLYMGIVKPFHKLIVKSILRNALERMKRNNTFQHLN